MTIAEVVEADMTIAEAVVTSKDVMMDAVAAVVTVDGSRETPVMISGAQIGMKNLDIPVAIIEVVKTTEVEATFADLTIAEVVMMDGKVGENPRLILTLPCK
mmetsp:Transcript_27013/g.44541  ORF Transcript_27013/g.44541 Transcript_27013/m.44541 type:complete len:102 (+) Transcript_27013:2560-2865(+)